MDTPQQQTRRRGVPPLVSDPARALTFYDPHWTFPSSCGAGKGSCGIRVFVTDEGGVLAVLEEKGLPGATFANSPEDAIPYLLRSLDLPPERLTVLDHWPDAQAGEGQGHVDLVELRAGTAHWMPVWPVPQDNPSYVELREWFERSGSGIMPDLP